MSRHRSLSRKEILRIAGRYAGRAAPVRRGPWKSWDAPTHSTPLSDIQRIRRSFSSPIGGTFTLTCGSQILSLPYDASKEVIKRAAAELLGSEYAALNLTLNNHGREVSSFEELYRTLYPDL